MRHSFPPLMLVGLLAVAACSSDGSEDTAGPVETAVVPTTIAATVPDVSTPANDAATSTEAATSTDTPPTTEAPVEPVALLAAGAEIGTPNGMFFDGQDRLWVASVGSGIFVVDPDSGETLEHYPGDVASADDLTVAADGTVYFTDIINGQVGIIAPDGTLLEERLAVAPGANSITFSEDGRLFVGADFLGDGLFEVDTTGTTPPRVVTPEPGWLNGMDFGPDGYIYAPRWTRGTIVRVDPETGELTTIADSSESVYSAVKFDADGALHAVEAFPGHVVEIDITTGEQTILATIDGVLDNLAFDSTGRLFVSNGQDGSIQEVLDDGTVRIVKAPGLSASSGISVDVIDGVERVTVLTTAAIVTLDGATGEELARSAGEGLPQLVGSLRLDDEGVLVLDWPSGGGVRVWDIDGDGVVATYPVDFGFDVIRFAGTLYSSQTLTNGVSRLSAEGSEIVFAANAPTGLAATSTELYVASHSDGTILQLAADGALLDAPRVIAEGLDAPEGLAVLPGGDLVVVETGSGTVTRVDVATGTTSVLANEISPAYTVMAFYPAFTPNGVAVAPSGNIYVTSPADGNVYRILAT